MPGAVEDAADEGPGTPEREDPADRAGGPEGPQGRDDAHVGAAEDERRAGGGEVDRRNRHGDEAADGTARGGGVVGDGRGGDGVRTGGLALLVVRRRLPGRVAVRVTFAGVRGEAWVDDPQHEPRCDGCELAHEQGPRRVPRRREPHPDGRACHERQLGRRRVERQGGAPLLARHRTDDDLAQDREGGHDEEPGQRREGDERGVADPRGDRPAHDLHDEGRADGAPQADAVEQPAAPGPGDGDRDGRGGRDQAGRAVAAAERRHDVEGEDDPASPHGDADEEAEQQRGAGVTVGQHRPVGPQIHGVSLSPRTDGAHPGSAQAAAHASATLG